LDGLRLRGLAKTENTIFCHPVPGHGIQSGVLVSAC